MNFLFHLALLLLVVIGGCKSSRSQAQAPPTSNAPDTLTSQTPANYRRVAEKRLGSGVEYVLNDDKTRVLGKKTQHPSVPAMVNEVHFLVIDAKTGVILLEDRLVNGAVEWFGNAQLKISTTPGIVQGLPNEPQYYLYDLVTKQKLPPTSDKY